MGCGFYPGGPAVHQDGRLRRVQPAHDAAGREQRGRGDRELGQGPKPRGAERRGLPADRKGGARRRGHHPQGAGGGPHPHLPQHRLERAGHA